MAHCPNRCATGVLQSKARERVEAAFMVVGILPPSTAARERIPETGLGFHIDTGVQGVRLAASGALPGFRIELSELFGAG